MGSEEASWRAALLPRLQDRQASEGHDVESEALAAHLLIEDAIRARASDIHLDPAVDHWQVRLRIDGRVVDALVLEWGEGVALVNQLKVLAGLDPVPSRVASEGSLNWSGEDEAHRPTFLRITAVNCVAGEKLAVRFLAPPRAFHDPSPWASGSRAHGAFGTGWMPPAACCWWRGPLAPARPPRSTPCSTSCGSVTATW